jgi:uncharacterized protein (DUF2141 family)
MRKLLYWFSALTVVAAAGCATQQQAEAPPADNGAERNASSDTGADAASAPEELATLTVEISGVRDDRGVVRVALFAGARGFPRDGEQAVKRVAIAPAEGRAEARFDNLRPGEYAVSVLHDANDNGKLDTGMFGRPTEGIGASNDAQANYGPPAYAEAAFDVPAGESSHTIQMSY